MFTYKTRWLAIDIYKEDTGNLGVQIQDWEVDGVDNYIEIPKEKVKQLIEFLKDNFLDNDK